MRIEISAHAKADLLAGFSFYEAQSKGVGTYFLDSLISDIDSLILKPMRAAELQVTLNWKDRVSLIQGVINPLIEAGLIARTRPQSPKSPLQKYGITDQGVLWLADHEE